ncbi:hypothetical protein CHH55_17965 [Niallia circulans]|uniref:hypothetical protein n=1 Tax=Niallia circulans TaxID=1397 RepID=UPI000BA7B8C8|nr:hypothetical protein [Niallia circulans]PAD86437.1 hypothetical protein CHH55_17965 [Niallia circulans]
MKIEANLQKDYQSVQRKLLVKKITTTPGIWVDGKTYWIQNGYEKLIPEHSISVHVKQMHKHSKIQYNEIFVRNHSQEPKKMKVLVLNYFPKAFHNHLSFVSPTENVIYHSIEEQLYLVNGEHNSSCMEQRTVQPLWNVHTDHIWSNNQNGTLKYQPMAKGSSVSIFSLNMEVMPQSTGISRSWSIMGTEKKDILDMNHILMKTSTSIS